MALAKSNSKRQSGTAEDKSRRAEREEKIREESWFLGTVDPMLGRSTLLSAEHKAGTFAVCAPHELMRSNPAELYLLVKTFDGDEDDMESQWRSAGHTKYRYRDPLPAGDDAKPLPLVLSLPIRRHSSSGQFNLISSDKEWGKPAFDSVTELLLHYLDRPLDMLDVVQVVHLIKPFERPPADERRKALSLHDMLYCDRPVPKITMTLLKCHEADVKAYPDKLIIDHRRRKPYYGPSYRGSVCFQKQRVTDQLIRMIKMESGVSVYRKAVNELTKRRNYGTNYVDPYTAIAFVAADNDETESAVSDSRRTKRKRSNGQKLVICRRFYQLGPLSKYLYSRRLDNERGRPTLSLRCKCEIAYQISEGMVFLERANLCHYNLAARNVMVLNAERQLVRVKLVDYNLPAFKLSTAADEGQKLTLDDLPYQWMAVESLTRAVFNRYSDVWSYGIVLCEIFMDGQDPYSEKQQKERSSDQQLLLEEAVAAVSCSNRLRDFLEQGKRHPTPADMPVYVESLMNDCFLSEPLTRPTFTSIARFWRDVLFDWVQLPSRAIHEYESRRRSKRRAAASGPSTKSN